MENNVRFIDEAVVFTTASGYIVVMNEDEYFECLESVSV